MKTSHALLLGVALVASQAAFAQYSWIDKDGRRVFSDRPPPIDVPEKNVLSKPRDRSGNAALAAPAAEEAASAVAAPASRPVTVGVDKALEEKKQQAEAEQAAKQKAEEQRVAAARADKCKRAMSANASLDSGMRMARTNDAGEREVLDDDQRAAERARAEKIIAADCQ
jgi:type IV secretory pathway VirB10-like protein